MRLIAYKLRRFYAKELMTKRKLFTRNINSHNAVSKIPKSKKGIVRQLLALETLNIMEMVLTISNEE